MWYCVIQTQFQFQFYILIGDQADSDKKRVRLEERKLTSEAIFSSLFFFKEHVINIFETARVALSVNLFWCL